MNEGTVLSGIKIVAALSSGAFGMMGLLTEYKDHATRRITRWGYVALGGILASTTMGVVAQVIESDQAARSAEEAAKRSAQTARLSEIASTQSSRGVHEIERILEPLKEPELDIGLELQCSESPSAQAICHDGTRSLEVALCCDAKRRPTAAIQVDNILDTRIARPDQVSGELEFENGLEVKYALPSAAGHFADEDRSLLVHLVTKGGESSGYKPPSSLVDFDHVDGKLSLSNVKMLDGFRIKYGHLKVSGGHRVMFVVRHDPGKCDEDNGRDIDISFKGVG